jgi:hypothetical protein
MYIYTPHQWFSKTNKLVLILDRDNETGGSQNCQIVQNFQKIETKLKLECTFDSENFPKTRTRNFLNPEADGYKQNRQTATTDCGNECFRRCTSHE